MIDITIPIRAQKSVKYLTLFLEKSYYFLCQSLKVYLLIKLFHIFPPLDLFFSSSRTGKKNQLEIVIFDNIGATCTCACLGLSSTPVRERAAVPELSQGAGVLAGPLISVVFYLN